MIRKLLPGEPVQSDDAFAVPLEDGRYAVVRVLRTVKDKKRFSALVAVTPWLEDHLPDLGEPQLRQILRMNRGFYKNRPAICWYEGEPPPDFVCLGKIPPSEEDLAIDPMGRDGGYWSRSMANHVVLEHKWTNGELRQSTGLERSVAVDVDRVTGVMGEDAFWDTIELLDWDAEDDEDVIEPVVQHLASLSPEEIAGFHRALCAKLHALDREEFAREIGEFSYGSTEGFSPDHFLDARCVVVANGQAFYEEALSDPGQMPKDMEFEALLTIAEEAYRRKTGRMPLFVGANKIETFSYQSGWAPSHR